MWNRYNIIPRPLTLNVISLLSYKTYIFNVSISLFFPFPMLLWVIRFQKFQILSNNYQYCCLKGNDFRYFQGILLVASSHFNKAIQTFKTSF